MVLLKRPQQFVEFAVILVKIFKFCVISPHLCKDTPIDSNVIN